MNGSRADGPPRRAYRRILRPARPQERALEERIAVATSTNAFLSQQLEAARAARAGRSGAGARSAAEAEAAAEARRNVLILKVFRVTLEDGGGGGGGGGVWGEAEPTTFLSAEFYASATQWGPRGGRHAPRALLLAQLLSPRPTPSDTAKQASKRTLCRIFLPALAFLGPR